ncbi:MAG: sigma 54-interacting transcriptional regulator [Candidatus Glassbacteria bacterium]|nr:sigma 54-interacting transcriptional regulator [Candidatus Glassbacteria bacterium]
MKKPVKPTAEKSKAAPEDLQRELNALRNRCRKLDLLYRISKSLGEEREYNKLLEIILDKVMSTLQAERGIIVTGSPEDFEVKVARNLEGEELPFDPRAVSRTVVRKVLEKAEPEFIKNVQDNESFSPSRSMVDLGMRSILCVPLIIDEEPYGAIYLENRSLAACFMEEDLELLRELAGLSANSIKNALNLLELSRGTTRIGEALRQDYDFSMIIGKSKRMIQVMELAARVASTDATVLITGDSGTGKELIARAIYLNSHRKEMPFLTINCGALPTGLLESELFGHVKGAFTGAYTNKVGRFEAADGGTILLDEVGEMPPELQVKLLRVLQFGEFEKVGSYKLQKVDVRLIAATNKDLKKMVEEGGFREDLYYRLKIIEIHFPPLRERPDDVPLLIDHFVKVHSGRLGKPVDNVEPQFIRFLSGYSFPGNVRELESIIQRAIILAQDNSITASELPPEVLSSPRSAAPAGGPLRETVIVARNNRELKTARDQATRRAVAEVERAFLETALDEARGNISKAAQDTGMNRSLFQRLVKKHKLQVDKSKYKKR